MLVPNGVVLAYPPCPECGNKNQWVDGPYGKTLEKTNILNVYEWDEGEEEEVEVPEKWECVECGHVWDDRDTEERVEKVRERKRKVKACKNIKKAFRERFDMRLRENKERWREIEDVTSLSELKRYFVENFDSGESVLKMLVRKAGGA